MANVSTAQSQTTLKLEKAYTFFMVPFYYEGDWEGIHQKITRWIPQQEELYKDEVLYPYIMELFKREGCAEDSNKKNRLKVFQLKYEDNGIHSQFFFDRIIGKRNVAILAPDANGRKLPYTITFKFCDKGNFAPHLFVSPTAGIGIMTFSLELTGDDCTISNLKSLNYHLHKRDEINKYRCICPLPETNLALPDAVFVQEVSKYSTAEEYKKLCVSKDKNRQDLVDWDINFFIGFLLNTLGNQPKPITYFNKARTHLFSFCSIDDSKTPAGTIRFWDIAPDLLRLSRGVIDKYLLPFYRLLNEGAILETYENIFFSTSIEGTAMMCVAKDVNKEYVVLMQEQFSRQYLLIYLLTLLQRYTLLDIDRKLIEYDSKTEKCEDKLWALIDIICKIKVNCYYTDVSIFTHHSQFYHHCCKHLHIPETFQEIDEKVNLLKITTDRVVQETLKEQQKLQENEAERHQTEIERLKAKEMEEERQRKQLAVQQAIEKDATERRQNLLNGIVAVLTIAQVIQAVFEIIRHRWQFSMWVSVSLGVLLLILLVCLMRKDIVNFIKPAKQIYTNI